MLGGRLGDHSQEEYRIPTLSGGDRDPIPGGEPRTRGAGCFCPSSMGTGAPMGTGVWDPVRRWPCCGRRSWVLTVQYGCSAQVRRLALRLAGGWRHSLSPARQRCLLTEDGVTREPIKQPAASAPAHSHAPRRRPGAGLGLQGGAEGAGHGPRGCVLLPFGSTSSGARGPITCGGHFRERRQPGALDGDVQAGLSEEASGCSGQEQGRGTKAGELWLLGSWPSEDNTRLQREPLWRGPVAPGSSQFQQDLGPCTRDRKERLEVGTPRGAAWGGAQSLAALSVPHGGRIH